MSLKRKGANLPTNDAKKPKANASITSFFGPPKTASSTTKVTQATTAAVPASSSQVSTKTANGTADIDAATAEVSDAEFLALEAAAQGEESAPAPAPAPAPAARSWDKEAWVNKLTEEQKGLLRLEIETLHDSWLKELRNEITTDSFLELKRFLKKESEAGKQIFPPSGDVYSWSRHTPLNTVKAVIIGQDPYHNVNQAHGLCFSVQAPTPAPPSLKNIYKLLKIEYPTFTPPPKNSGLLTPWADRGVLLLNTCLTVRAHEANSHSNRGWEKFTQKVIDLVAQKRTRGVVFLAWGSPAAKRVVKVDKKKHLVLQSVHPSPLSASRGFFECGHFRKTNEWLVQRYGEGAEIDWDLGNALAGKV